MTAVEEGSGAASLLGTIQTREADIRRIQGELEALAEPLERKLAVMPPWLRRQLEDLRRLEQG